MPMQGNVRRNSDGGCGKVAKDQSNHLVADSLRSFHHFQEKRMIRGIGKALFSNFLKHQSCGNFVQPLVQVITLSANLGKQKIGDEG